MRNFQDTCETRKGSFISAFSICMTVPLSNELTSKMWTYLILFGNRYRSLLLTSDKFNIQYIELVLLLLTLSMF